MSLWRVEVAAVSHRYVEADSAQEAEELVIAAIIAGLLIEASAANRELAKQYNEAGPIRRKRLIASMDGLISPTSRRDVRRERRRLERVMKWEERTRAWLAEHDDPNAPEPDPLILDRLTRMSEIQHIESNMHRLANWERRSPMHDGHV